jgi:lipopolysaccharide export system protein LptA
LFSRSELKTIPAFSLINRSKPVTCKNEPVTELQLPMSKYAFKYIIILIITCTYFYPVQASNIHIDHADKLARRTIEGEDVRILTGNVQVRQDEMTMACDSAVQFPNRNYLKAFGNIHIKQGDSVHLYGNRLLYDGNKRETVIEENVRLEEGTMTLYTNRLFYDLNTGKGYYLEGGKIVDNENTLVSRKGFYFSDKKELSFQDSVILTNPDFVLNSDTLLYEVETSIARVVGPARIIREKDLLYCEKGWYDTGNESGKVWQNSWLRRESQYLFADTISFDRLAGSGKAQQNVYMKDTVENLHLFGHLAEWTETPDQTFFTDSASAMFINRDDTLWLAADTLFSENDGGNRVFKAFYNTRAFSRSFQAVCDSAVYNENDSLLHLYRKPVLWFDEHQITADTIAVKFDGEHISTMYLLQNAFLITSHDTLFYDQIRGRRMTGYFRNNELYRVEVAGNAEGFYFLQDNDDKYIGFNRIESSDMRIGVEEREINDITFLRKPEARVYPMHAMEPGEIRLRGFSLQGDRRPRQPEEIFLQKSATPDPVMEGLLVPE